jgi:AhpD family alkylhydroperoxidase
MKGFAGIAQAALAPKALDAKTKELIAVAVRCDDCIGFHVKPAIERGASEAEVAEALRIAIYMGAGSSVMYASHALEAFHQVANERRGAAIMNSGDQIRRTNSAPQL